MTGSGGACAIGVKIPRDFIGQGSITLGRPAQPGEAYEATTSAFAPGESLHCSGLENQQVAQALPTIQADKITAYWDVAGSNDPPPVLGATTGPQVPDTTPPPGNYYITNANPVAAGVVWFITSPTPLPAADIQRGPDDIQPGLLELPTLTALVHVPRAPSPRSYSRPSIGRRLNHPHASDGAPKTTSSRRRSRSARYCFP